MYRHTRQPFLHCKPTTRLPKQGVGQEAGLVTGLQPRQGRAVRAASTGRNAPHLVSIMSSTRVPCLFSSTPLEITFLYPRRYLRVRGHP